MGDQDGFERSYALEGSAGQHDPHMIAAIVSRMVPSRLLVQLLYTFVYIRTMWCGGSWILRSSTVRLAERQLQPSVAHRHSLQLRVLRFGLLQDRDFWINAIPEWFINGNSQLA
jgi:hypothetical protein